MSNTPIFVLGGSRSGKSRWAEQRAQESALEVVYVATATAGDAEMQTRIARHQAQRPAHWALVEEPLALADALWANARPDRCLLVDCLTLWLTNLLLFSDTGRLARERAELLCALPQLPGQIILVSNETGLGILPLGELTRRYSDEIGLLHQDVARLCDPVVFMLAGLPHYLKGSSV